VQKSLIDVEEEHFSYLGIRISSRRGS